LFNWLTFVEFSYFTNYLADNTQYKIDFKDYFHDGSVQIDKKLMLSNSFKKNKMQLFLQQSCTHKGNYLEKQTFASRVR